MVLDNLCLGNIFNVEKIRCLSRHGTVVGNVFVKVPTVRVLAFVFLVYEPFVRFSPVVKG